MTFKTTKEIQDFDWKYAHSFKTFEEFLNQEWISKEDYDKEINSFIKRSLYCCDCKKNFALICGECNIKELKKYLKKVDKGGRK